MVQLWPKKLLGHFFLDTAPTISFRLSADFRLVCFLHISFLDATLFLIIGAGKGYKRTRLVAVERFEWETGKLNPAKRPAPGAALFLNAAPSAKPNRVY